MKRITSLLLALAALAAFASVSFAGTPRINAREARQHARIHQGVASGQLARGEAMRLRAGQRGIRRMERVARADGVVTPRERAIISHAQTHESRAIYRMKHNGRTL